jgi:hypothetical protein
MSRVSRRDFLTAAASGAAAATFLPASASALRLPTPPDAIRLRPARVVPVETSFMHAVHAYHGVCPWSRDESKLVYLGFDDPRGEASVVVREMATGRETTVATTRAFDFHTAAWQRWVLNDEAILFQTLGPDGELQAALVFPDGGDGIQPLRQIPHRIVRHVSADSIHAFVYGTLRAEYRAIERLNLRTGELETIVTIEQALSAMPVGSYTPGARFFMNHPVTNADDTRLFFKLLQNTGEEASDEIGFFTMDLISGTVRFLGDEISGHPFWLADGRRILNIQGTGEGLDYRWLVAMDSESGRIDRLFDQKIDGPGHPSLAPTGRWIVTDSFALDGLVRRSPRTEFANESPIYLGDLSTGVLDRIARIDHRFRGGSPYRPEDVTRGQPHPTWSPGGTRIIANHNHGGTRMGIVILEDFLTSV